MINNQVKNKLISIFKKEPVITAYLFGSQATGNISHLSDYDFAVQVDTAVKEDDYFDLRLKIMETISGLLRTDKVDVVVINDTRLPLSFQFRIIKEGKVLYCRDEIQRGRLEVRVLSEYLDRKYYLDRHISHSLAKFAKEGLSL